MATTNSSLISSTSNIVGVRSAGDAVVVVLPASETINTVSPAFAALDVHRLFEVPNGSELKSLYYDFADMDTDGTETLDLDIILQDDDGDTVLFNGGTTFEDAATGKVLLQDQFVNAKNTGVGYLALLSVTAAATGVAAAVLKMEFIYH